MPNTEFEYKVKYSNVAFKVVKASTIAEAWKKANAIKRIDGKPVFPLYIQKI